MTEQDEPSIPEGMEALANLLTSSLTRRDVRMHLHATRNILPLTRAKMFAKMMTPDHANYTWDQWIRFVSWAEVVCAKPLAWEDR